MLRTKKGQKKEKKRTQNGNQVWYYVYDEIIIRDL